MTSEQILPRAMAIDEFTPHVGKAFRVNCTPKDVDIVLIEATALKNYGVSTQPPFTLVFHSPPTAMLLAGTYVMRSGTLDPFAIHLETLLPPLGAAPGYYYQAQFN